MNAPTTTANRRHLPANTRTDRARPHSSNRQPERNGARGRPDGGFAPDGSQAPARLKPGGCMAVTMQAMRWNMDPFALAVKTYHGGRRRSRGVRGPGHHRRAEQLSAVGHQAFVHLGGRGGALSASSRWSKQTKRTNDGNPKNNIVPAWDFDRRRRRQGDRFGNAGGRERFRVLELLVKNRLAPATVRCGPKTTEAAAGVPGRPPLGASARV